MTRIDQLLIKFLAFIHRDLYNEASYKFSFVTNLLGMIFSAFSLYFLSRLVGKTANPYLAAYGGDYLSFVMIGVALAGYMQISLGAFAASIREAQTTGTLEAMLVTRTSVATIIIASALYRFLVTSLRVILYLILGVLLFGIPIKSSNIFGVVLILILTIVCFSGIGMLSACFILILKKGDPFHWLFTGLSWLLGGVYYPVAVLPKWLQQAAALLPITHALEGIRGALLRGDSLTDLLPSILPLILFGSIVIPLAVFCFKGAVRIAKDNGSLTQY